MVSMKSGQTDTHAASHQTPRTFTKTRVYRYGVSSSLVVVGRNELFVVYNIYSRVERNNRMNHLIVLISILIRMASVRGKHSNNNNQMEMFDNTLFMKSNPTI